MLSTETLSLNRWDIALRRLDEYIDDQRQALDANLAPVELDINTRELLLPRAQAAHQRVFTLITELSQAFALQSHIGGLYRRAEVSFGLQDLDVQIEGLRSVSTLLSKLTEAPSRHEVLHELEYAHKEFDRLRVQGEGDVTRAERQRLRSLKFNIPAVGHEDLVRLWEYHDRIKADLDALTAQSIEIRARSGFHIDLPADHKILATKLGLRVRQVQQEPQQATGREAHYQNTTEDDAEVPQVDVVQTLAPEAQPEKTAQPQHAEPLEPVEDSADNAEEFQRSPAVFAENSAQEPLQNSNEQTETGRADKL